MTNFYQKLIDTNLGQGATVNIKIYEISELVFELPLPQNVCFTQTDIFQILANRVQDFPKRESFKNHKNEFFTKEKKLLVLFLLKLKTAQKRSVMNYVLINQIGVYFYCKYVTFKIL